MLVEIEPVFVADVETGAARISDISAPAEFSLVLSEFAVGPASVSEQLEISTAALRAASRRHRRLREGAVVKRDMQKLSVARAGNKQAVHS